MIQPIDALLQAIEQVWMKGTAPSERLLDEPETQARLQKLITEMLAVQQLAMALASGDLAQPLQVKGMMAGALKALQANLRHLSWQTQMVTRGDFSQRVDFMGEFSESFNSMVQNLEDARTRLRQREIDLTQVNAQLHAEIAERQRAEEKLRESEELYRSIIHASPDDITVTDLQGIIQLVSPAAIKLTGYETERPLIGKPITDFVAPPDRERAIRSIQNIIHGTLFGPEEYQLLRADGTLLDVEANGEIIQDADGSPYQLVFIIRDITERKHAEEVIREGNERLRTQLTEIQALQAQLREQAIRDPLTQLFNRRYLQETLTRELASTQRERAALAVILLDIDRFKRINDQHGHHAGDLMLQSLADILRSQTRQMDVACRYGGEEFVVVMPGASLDAARTRAEQLRSYVEELSVEYETLCLQITLSLGVAAFPQHGATSDELLRAADDALYEAKVAGRNRVITAH